MASIEKLSEVIASKVSLKLSIDDQDKKEILAYGAFVLIQTLLTIFMIAIFGIFFNVFIEALIISFTASILRKSSGGAHATSPMNCAIISVIIFGGLALLVKHYILSIDFLYLVSGIGLAFIFTYYIMFRYSPVETVNKPLKNQSKRNRLKKLSFTTVHIFLLISIIFVIFYFQLQREQLILISICISVGILWQSITMISLGHIIIDGLDKALRGIKKLIRRER